MNDRWPNQERALAETTAAIEGGSKRLCVTSPTGTGKSRMMVDMLEWATASGKRAALFTNRRMLFDQTCGVLESHGINFEDSNGFANLLAASAAAAARNGQQKSRAEVAMAKLIEMTLEKASTHNLPLPDDLAAKIVDIHAQDDEPDDVLTTSDKKKVQ